MDKSVYNKVITEIVLRIQEHSDVIVMGNLDEREYALSCGKIQGLKTALEVYNEIWSKYMKEDGDY